MIRQTLIGLAAIAMASHLQAESTAAWGMSGNPPAAGGAGCTVAPSPVDVPLWPEGRMPGLTVVEPKGLTVHQRNWKYTHVPVPGMTIFRPTTAKDGEACPALPAMVVCSGGGYGVLAWAKEGTEVAEWLNSIGVVAIVLKYRVPNCREGALQDLQRAVRLIRHQASEWNIDDRHLIVSTR